MKATLGGTPVTVHESGTLDPGRLSAWMRAQAPGTLLGLDSEGLPFNHEDRANHYGPLRSKWLRLVQVADANEAWNLDPGHPGHRRALDAILSGPARYRFVTWGSFDPEAVFTVLGHDITDRYYSGKTLADLLKPGPLEAHDLKEWAARLGMPELREAQAAQEAMWDRLKVDAPRKPVRPRRRQKETDDQYAERLTTWRLDSLVKWQRAVHEHYERFPLREAARETATGGYKSGWSGWRDVPLHEPVYQLYAGLDAIAVRRAWPKMVEMAKEVGLGPALGREVRIEQVVTRHLKIQGTRVDVPHAETILGEVKPRHLEAKAAFLELTGLKAGSPKRVEWLQAMGIKWPEKAVTKTGAPSLGAQHVKDLLARYAGSDVDPDAYRALQLIQEAGSTQNLTTFVGGILEMVDEDGRIHPTFNVLGAETGRWTARSPAVQTFSNKNGTRGIVVPETGHALVSIDQAQIEVRVFAGASECGDLIDAFNRGEDVYGVVAGRLFGPQWTKRDRALCKRIILGGCLYAGGPATLRTQLHDLDGVVISEDAIRQTRTDFYTAYPEGRKFIRRMTSDRDVWLPSGRYVPGDSEREYRGTNSYCQGTARDIIMDTLLDIARMGPKYAAMMRMFVHDEGIFSIPLDILEDTLVRFRGAFRRSFMGVKIDCDVEVYPERWGGEMATWKGPGRWVREFRGPDGKYTVEFSTLDEAISATE